MGASRLQRRLARRSAGECWLITWRRTRRTWHPIFPRFVETTGRTAAATLHEVPWIQSGQSQAGDVVDSIQSSPYSEVFHGGHTGLRMHGRTRSRRRNRLATGGEMLDWDTGRVGRRRMKDEEVLPLLAEFTDHGWDTIWLG